MDIETLALGAALALLMLFTIYQTMNIMGTVQTLKHSVEKTVNEVEAANRNIVSSNALLNKTIDKLEKKIEDLNVQQEKFEKKIAELSATSSELKKVVEDTVKKIDADVEKMLNMTAEMKNYLASEFKGVNRNIADLRNYMNETFNEIFKELMELRNETKSMLKYIISKNLAIENKLEVVSKRLERLENATYETMMLMQKNYKEMVDLKNVVEYNTKAVLELKDLANKTYTSLVSLKTRVTSELNAIKEDIKGGMEKLRVQMLASVKDEMEKLKEDILSSIKGEISGLRGSLNSLNTLVMVNMVLTVLGFGIIAAKVFGLLG